MDAADTNADGRDVAPSSADRLARRDLVLIGLQAGRRGGVRRPRAVAPRPRTSLEVPKARSARSADGPAAVRR